MPKELHIEFTVCKQDTPLPQQLRNSVLFLDWILMVLAAPTTAIKIKYSTTLIAQWNVEQQSSA